jgi:Uma2 family endonuclease
MNTTTFGEAPDALASLIAERKRLGLDTHDEVRAGEFHMAPMASFEHAKVEATLVRLLHNKSEPEGLTVTTAFNLGVADDYRVPDLGVHRGEPSGVWLPTAVIVVEVRSPDETFEKFGFYFGRGVEEILVADLVTKQVAWFRRSESGFVAAQNTNVIDLSSTDVEHVLGW